LEFYREKILIADKEINICQLLTARLSKLGYKVFFANNGKDALLNFRQEQPDLVVLDTTLPILDGYEVYIKIREDSKVPVIMLCGLKNISERILSLELGVNDCIQKPFSPKELEIKIRSILGPTSLPNQKFQKKKINIGKLAIDMNTKIVSKGNSEVRLTDIEYRLLEMLVENIGKTLSRTVILENIWGYKPERYLDTRIVDVHISRLRIKIEENPSKPDFITTSRGIGYMFQEY